MVAAAVSSTAQLVPAVPIPPLAKAGLLSLSGDRLRFTTPEGGAVLDALVGELHSVSRSAMGVTLYHGDRKLRFAMRGDGIAAPTPDSWVEALRAVVGEPPAGLHVRAPWPTWAWVAALSGVIVAILAVVTAINGL
jgi:hypothetical protein